MILREMRGLGSARDLGKKGQLARVEAKSKGNTPTRYRDPARRGMFDMIEMLRPDAAGIC